MLVTVKYFGMILEQVHLAHETLELKENTSIQELESLLLERYPSLENMTYNIALNLSITDKTTLLKDGDELAFLPPFAGG